MLTIVIPFYNGERWLPHLLQSLTHSKAQGFRGVSLEIIIIIDSVQTPQHTVEQLAMSNIQSPDIRYKIIKIRSILESHVLAISAWHMQQENTSHS